MQTIFFLIISGLLRLLQIPSDTVTRIQLCFTKIMNLKMMSLLIEWKEGYALTFSFLRML